MVVGARIERVGYSRFGRFASFMYNRVLIPILFNVGIDDVNWISTYRKKLFTEKILDFQPSRIFFLVEILIRAKRNKLIVAEVPSRMRIRTHGDPTSTRFSVMWETLIDMLNVLRQVPKGKSW